MPTMSVRRSSGSVPRLSISSTFPDSSSSWRCSSFSRFGTSSLSRAWTHLAAARELGAPRPRMRSSLPSSEPAGTFSETAPSGVGTWKVVRAPRRGNDSGPTRAARCRDARTVSHGSTCVTTKRSPAGRAAVPGLALPLEQDARAVLDAGGVLDRVALRAPLAPGSFALWAGSSITVRCRGSRARLREREKPLRPRRRRRGRCSPGRCAVTCRASAPEPWHSEQAVSSSTGTCT